jgi:hypothetical protein
MFSRFRTFYSFKNKICPKIKFPSVTRRCNTEFVPPHTQYFDILTSLKQTQESKKIKIIFEIFVKTLAGLIFGKRTGKFWNLREKLSNYFEIRLKVLLNNSEIYLKWSKKKSKSGWVEAAELKFCKNMFC